MGNCQLRSHLFTAVESGDVASVDRVLALFDPQSDLSFTQPPVNNTPLHIACICGYAPIVSSILAYSLSPSSSTPDMHIIDARDSDGRSPLYVASLGGHVDVVSALLSAGAPIDSKSKTGLTPIFVAAWRGHVSVVRLLMTSGADLMARDEEGQYAWTMARKWDHNDIADEMEKLAKQKGWKGEVANDASVVIEIKSDVESPN